MVREVSVILPTYNEAENISILIPLIFDRLKDYNVEVVVVDDNSPDKTWKVAELLGKRYNVRVVRRIGRRGLASAILDGIKAAKNDVCVVMDADLQHRPEEIEKFIFWINKGYDVVIGSRYVDGGVDSGLRGKRRVDSKVASFLSKLFLSVKITDPMSGFFAVRKSKLRLNERWYTIGYKFLLELVVRYPKLRVKEVPIVFRKRLYGRSKMYYREKVRFLLLLLFLFIERLKSIAKL